LIAGVAKSLAGGATLLQLGKGWTDQTEALSVGREVLRLARAYNVPLLVSDDIHLAQELGAQGVHLDRDDLKPHAVRAALGESALVGVTIGNSLDKARQAEVDRADYISFCAIFPSTSVQRRDIVPLATVREARRAVHLPIFASGGINERNAAQVLEAGADGIAVISAIFQAKDPEAVARTLTSLIESKKGHIRLPAS
jgi:thiamine-phosphate diphosphorylase